MSGQPAVHPTAQVKTERLLNLVIALLSTRMPLSKARIRAAVPQYHGTASDEAFDRMFERDKDELREMGIPLVTTVIDALFDDEVGYRIDKREYALPEISFEPDEVAALALAARTWSRASLAGPAASGLRKLRLAGVDIDESSLVGIEPRVRTTEEAFEPLRRAVARPAPITFGYRKTDGGEQYAARPAVGAGPVARALVPHRLRRRPGRRARLPGRADRGPVTASGPAGAYDIPDGPRCPGDGRLHPGPDAPPRVATLRVRDGQRQRAAAPRPRRGRRRGARADGVAGDGWSTVEVDFRDVDRLADEVAGLRPGGRRGRAARPHRGRRPTAARGRADPASPPARRSCDAAAAASRPSRPRPALSRLLDMVPWLLAHQGVPLEDAAAEFGVSTDQLVADLELLFVCGTPAGCRTSSSRRSGRTARSSSATPTTSPGRCGSRATRRSR